MAEPMQDRELSAAELFREHGAFVARFLFRLGVPADAVDDAVQEVFLVVHQRGGYRPGPAKPTSYLAVIAVNAAAAQRRRSRSQAAKIDGAQPDELVARDNPERSLETRDALERLQRALDRLDPELRATLLLADGEEETCASIAEAMSIPVGTVYWRLHEARKKFQRALSAVDAASKNWRATRQAPEAAASAPVFGRRPGVLTMAVGWIVPRWRGSEAHTLLRETAKEMPIDYDVQMGLSRHVDAVARLPATSMSNVQLAPQPGVGVIGSTTGALKLGLIVVAGGAALLAALSLQPQREMDMARRAENDTDPLAADRGPPHAAPSVEGLDEPTDGEGTPLSQETAVNASAASATPRASQDPATSHASGRTLAHSLGSVGTTRGGARASIGTTRATEQAERASSRGTEEQPAAEAEDKKPTAQAGAPTSEGILEAQALGRADSLLRTDPAQALAIARKVAVHGRSDYLAEERLYIEVMALYALNKQADAERAAVAFLWAYPQSVFGERVRRARGGANGK